jgi:hypothetical protein
VAHETVRVTPHPRTVGGRDWRGRSWRSGCRRRKRRNHEVEEGVTRSSRGIPVLDQTKNFEAQYVIVIIVIS